MLAGILFFLNPHLPFEPGIVARGFLVYAGLLSVPSLAVLLPVTWGRPRRARRLVPWALTVVMAGAGLSAWTNAHYFAYFLPPGINRRLLKAAVWLTLAALIGFYAALLHRLRRRPYGTRSRLLLAFVAVASLYVVVERREAFKATPGPAPRPTTVEGAQRPRLLVVGLEGATLDAILPLAEQGRLPFLATVLRQGAHARLRTIQPTRRGPLWSTLATGKYPFQHGIVGDREYHAPLLGDGAWLSLFPIGTGFRRWGALDHVRPVDARRRRVEALWGMLAKLGIPAGIVGWPFSGPLDEDVSVGVSDRFFRGAETAQDVHPAELGQRARLFRLRTDEIDPSLAARFGVPAPERVLDTLAQDLWREDLAFFLLDQNPRTEAFFVALPGLGWMSRRYFGGYEAVQFEGAQEAESRQAARLLAAYYMQLDEFLGRLWERTRGPRLLAVVSAHGMGAPHGMSELVRELTRRPALAGSLDGRPDGVFLLFGEGVQPGAMPARAELVDLVPTLLYGLGLPIARDFDGAVLTADFDTTFLARHPLTFVPSYETLTP